VFGVMLLLNLSDGAMPIADIRPARLRGRDAATRWRLRLWVSPIRYRGDGGGADRHGSTPRWAGRC
jgi:hypothetical protein